MISSRHEAWRWARRHWQGIAVQMESQATAMKGSRLHAACKQAVLLGSRLSIQQRHGKCVGGPTCCCHNRETSCNPQTAAHTFITLLQMLPLLLLLSSQHSNSVSTSAVQTLQLSRAFAHQLEHVLIPCIRRQSPQWSCLAQVPLMSSDLARAGWLKQRPPMQLPRLALINALVKLGRYEACETGQEA